MLIYLIVTFVCAAIGAFYWGARFAEVAAQPNGGLAAFAILSPFGSVSIVLVVAAVGIAICNRLDKQRSETVAMKDAMNRAVRAIESSTQPREATTTQYAGRPAGAAVSSRADDGSIIKMNDLPVHAILRASSGRLEELDALLGVLQGEWVGGDFNPASLTMRRPDSDKIMMVYVSEITRIGESQATMTRDVQPFLRQAAADALRRERG